MLYEYIKRFFQKISKKCKKELNKADINLCGSFLLFRKRTTLLNLELDLSIYWKENEI